MNVRGVGEYIRTQRTNARLSLRKLSGLAGVSIPYLYQVERGLRKPSADILQAIAKALRISAETLYVQAGILDDRAVPDVMTAILADPTITERQKQALIQIYDAFREETGRGPEAGPVNAPSPARPEADLSKVSAAGTPRREIRRERSSRSESGSPRGSGRSDSQTGGRMVGPVEATASLYAPSSRRNRAKGGAHDGNSKQG